jgi:hypothetical protein
MTIVFFARGEFFNEDSWSWFVLGFVLSLTVFCSAGFIGFWQLAGWAQERDEMHNDPSQRK